MHEMRAGKRVAVHAQMRVWRVEDWALVATVSEPFQKGWVSNTFSLRLCWSPEGQSLTAVNSYQSPCHTVALLDRRTWKYDFSMVGHSGEHVILQTIVSLLYWYADATLPYTVSEIVLL